MGPKIGIWINEHDFQETTDRTALTTEIANRIRAGDALGWGLNLPNPDVVLRNTGQDITVYRDLLVDAHVGACVTSRKSGVKSLEWGIDRGKATSKTAKFIEMLFKDLDIIKITSEILDAPLFGYQPLEIMWKEVGGMVVPTDVVGKPQNWFTFDPQNNLRFMSLQNPIGEELPPMKFILATHEATYVNPYGFPILSRCFWPVAFKKGGVKFWIRFIEKYGGAFAIGKHPRGCQQSETDALADMLAKMIQSAIAVIPDDSSVELKSAEKSGTADIFDRLLAFCNAEISKAVLGQTLTTEVGDKGSYAASQTHGTIRTDIVDSDVKIVEDAFNTLIKWVCELNFGGNERPVFSMWEEEDVDDTLANRDKTLSDTGQVKFTKPYFMKAYGFEEDDIEIVERAAPSPQPGNPPTAEFSEPAGPRTKTRYPDQEAVDELSNAIPAELLQSQAEEVMKSVMSLVKSAGSIEEIMEKLVTLYPDVKTESLQEMLSRLLFITELWGRLNAQG